MEKGRLVADAALVYLTRPTFHTACEAALLSQIDRKRWPWCDVMLREIMLREIALTF
jgi:hypothetical protein